MAAARALSGEEVSGLASNAAENEESREELGSRELRRRAFSRLYNG